MLTVIAWLGVFAIGAFAGYHISGLLRGETKPDRADAAMAASWAALQDAREDGAKIARRAWDSAGQRALREGRSKAPQRSWAALTPDQREGAYRISAATVEVLQEDAADRVRKARE